MKRRVLIIAAVVVACTRSARAQEDPRKAQAEALFNEGLKLHDKDRETEALERFERSYAAFPSPNTLYWIAREEQLVGRNLSALRHYREASRSPLLYSKNLELAKKNIAELEVRYARVAVTGPAGTKLKLGDREVRLPLAPDDVLDVEPGPIAVEGDRDGSKYEAKGVARAGEKLTLELAAVPGREAGAGVLVEPPPPYASERGTWWSGTKTAAVIVWAGAAAAGVAGAVLLGESGSRADHGREITAGIPSCTGSTLPACEEAKRDSSAAASLKTGGWIAIGGALALAATGVVLFVLPSNGKTSAKSSIGLRGASLAFTHSF